MKTGLDYPLGAVEFEAPILKVSLGCGYLGVIDQNFKAYMWGDNFAG